MLSGFGDFGIYHDCSAKLVQLRFLQKALFNIWGLETMICVFRRTVSDDTDEDCEDDRIAISAVSKYAVMTTKIFKVKMDNGTDGKYQS